jgi:hypothetical protein
MSSGLAMPLVGPSLLDPPPPPLLHAASAATPSIAAHILIRTAMKSPHPDRPAPEPHIAFALV